MASSVVIHLNSAKRTLISKLIFTFPICKWLTRNRTIRNRKIGNKNRILNFQEEKGVVSSDTEKYLQRQLDAFSTIIDFSIPLSFIFRSWQWF